jgi:hypothetical protein
MCVHALHSSEHRRCDTSGAGYAIYWCNVDGQLVVASDYVTEERKAELAKKGFDKSFAEESEAFALSTTADGPVATCYKTGEPVFVEDVATSQMKRKALAAKYGIGQVAWVPMEGGVMEFGTSVGDSTATWDELPKCPTMPKEEMRKGLENLGASYCLFWQNKNMEFRVVADYTTESRKEALAQYRGDDKTFAAESRKIMLVRTAPPIERRVAWHAAALRVPMYHSPVGPRACSEAPSPPHTSTSLCVLAV